MVKDNIIIAGTVSGIVEHWVGFIPRSILDHNQLNNNHFKSNTDIFKIIYAEQGFRSFYKGYVPMLAGISVAHIWLFNCYEYHKKSTSTFDSILYSCLGKIGHDILLIPGDTIRIRNNVSGLNNVETIKN